MQREFIFTDKWLDLLFEHRNRSYGAYELRKRQPDNVIIGWLTAVFFIGSLSFIGYEWSKITAENTPVSVPKKEDVYQYIRTVILPAKQVEPVNEPAKNNSPKTPSSAAVAPLAKDDVEKKDDTKKEPVDDFKKPIDDGPIALIDNRGGTKDGPVVDDIPVSTEPFKIVEKMPVFPGGETALLDFIAKNTRYPKKFIDEDITGTVYVSFVVDEYGNVKKVSLTRGIEGYPEFGDAAMSSVLKMPQWTPGRQNGVNVAVLYTVPVSFSLRKGF